MLPLRLVIDTNVLVSAALKPEGLQRTTFLLATTKPARLYVTQVCGRAVPPRVAYPQRGTPAVATADQEQQPRRRTLAPSGRVQRPG